jgi:methionyl-tRNA synthetase
MAAPLPEVMAGLSGMAKERIFIGVAWPYANNSLHLGHIAGCCLPADIFARYHRVKGNDVLMVSGSDQHGTPITVRAEEEGVSPQEIVAKYHQQFQECWKGLGISFDLYTTTGTANHRQTVHEIFLKLLNDGQIFKKTMRQPYCTVAGRFLPDRYVEGTCPNCGKPGARGDQCDNCGRPTDPIELRDILCRLHKDTPEFRDTDHYFLRLTAFEAGLREWVARQDHWRPNVRNFTARYLESGLQDRAITRDLEWGVPIPVPGYDSKRIYVWFEAVIGYMSAAKEWAGRSGDPEAWRRFWTGEDSRHYYFIGKDNIPFHTIIWPAMIMGFGGGLKLPFDVPANEFLNLEGLKFSKSRNWAVWVPDYIEEFAPDPLRYVLSINMPETADTDFSWKEFLRRNNDELVATYGNLVNRVLSFTYRSCDGKVPQPAPEGQMDAGSRALLRRAGEVVREVDECLAGCRFRDGIRAAMDLAREANRYLEEQAPWKRIREDFSGAATALYVAMCVISALKTVMYPYMPFSSEKVHGYLGFEGDAAGAGWSLRRPQPGQSLQRPEPLFAKLDDALIAEKMAQAGITTPSPR